MINDEQFDRITASIPLLNHASPDLIDEFLDEAFIARVPAGRDMIMEGDRINAIPLLISGVVRVYQIGETGREVTLYRFRPGESCVLTTNAVLRQQSFPAIATVEQDAEAVMIPADTFRDWVRRYDLWRDFVFELVSQRLASVMAIVDDVAFKRLDTRVGSYLLAKSRSQNPIYATHQEIAAELGSSREVISRILEDFSNKSLIIPGRGMIEVVDFDGLEALIEL
jgi:CRP/FNR family transcriptional regulator